ncbi:MAG: DNA primase [Chitinispirillaceae bacterium]|nr:DNA primase [Chitinispirillaceae bacterium]
MPPFDDHIKEDIRSRSDIAAVIGRYVTLKGSGQTLKGLCPFHKEKTPSFHVNPTQGFYHCFGCGKGGDVFSFVQEMEGVSFPEALAMLAEECGVVIEHAPSSSPAEYPDGDHYAPQDHFTGNKISKTDLYRIHETAARFFYRNIRPSPPAVDYLKSRELKPETVRDFRLGFAPESWTGLIDFCKKEGIGEEALVSCGLAIKKENGRCYDRFRNRVIFSLCDLSGRVIGFAGRGMETDAVPKYLNSPETLLYKKKHFLYGLYRSRQAIKEQQTVIVVEGYMDYLTLFQAGIQNVVASSGTALTPEHARLLSRFTRSVILTFDGDNAGQSAAEKAIFTLAPLNIELSVLILPKNEDPDSLVKEQGKEVFEAQISNALPWSDFIIQKMCQTHNFNTASGKTTIIKALAPLIKSLQDQNAVMIFTNKLAEAIRTTEKIVLSQIFPKKQTLDTSNHFYLNDDLIFQKSLEGQFLRYLLINPELIKEARNFILPETLTDGVSSDIYSLLLSTYSQNQNLNNILDYTNNTELKRIISLLQVKEDTTESIHNEFVQKVIHLRKKYLNSQLRECKLQMKRQPHRRSELLQQLQDYMAQLHELDGGE